MGVSVILASAATGCTSEISGGGPGGSGDSGSDSGSTGTGSSAGGANSSGSTGTSATSQSTSAGTTQGTSATTGGEPGGASVSLPGAPIYTRFYRLTNDQWENAVEDLLNLDGPTGLSDDFLHAVSGTTDFDNNERVVVINNTVWSDLERAAETVAAQVTATDAALQQVVQTTDPTTFIQTFGRRAFRRDLTQDEVATYTALFQHAATYSGSQSAFTKGAGLVIEAMLQSPHFLYRTEMADDGAPLTGYEMAAKLSLWIRDTTPTDAMLDAARDGEFDTPDGAANWATQMIADPASVDVMRKFHGELYKLQVIETIEKTGVQGFTAALIPEFSEASYDFFDRIYSENLGVKDILTSTVAFAGPNMARLYGLNLQGQTVQQVDMPDRAGFFSQPPFLSLWAINNDPDSIHRGVRIVLDALCADPGTPNVDLPPVPAIEPGQTNRERYETMTKTCGNPCHSQIINPIGFAFENFDGLGRYRDMDNGKPVDASGTYTFAEGAQTFSGATELMGYIASGSQAQECYAKKLASYALQRDIVDAERPLVVSLGQVSLQGGSLKDLMIALAKSDSFRTHVGGGT